MKMVLLFTFIPWILASARLIWFLNPKERRAEGSRKRRKFLKEIWYFVCSFPTTCWKCHNILWWLFSNTLHVLSAIQQQLLYKSLFPLNERRMDQLNSLPSFIQEEVASLSKTCVYPHRQSTFILKLTFRSLDVGYRSWIDWLIFCSPTLKSVA